MIGMQPELKSDEEAETFVADSDLTEYDLSAISRIPSFEATRL